MTRIYVFLSHFLQKYYSVNFIASDFEYTSNILAINKIYLTYCAIKQIVFSNIRYVYCVQRNVYKIIILALSLSSFYAFSKYEIILFPKCHVN